MDYKREATEKNYAVNEMLEFVCDKLCKYPHELTDEELTEHCETCEISNYTHRILRAHTHDLAVSVIEDLYKIVKEHCKIVLCKDCLHRARDRDEHGKYYWCRNDAGKRGHLSEHDGCSSGKRV